jgi:hypothetical protein
VTAGPCRKAAQLCLDVRICSRKGAEGVQDCPQGNFSNLVAASDIKMALRAALMTFASLRLCVNPIFFPDAKRSIGR